MKVKDLSMYGSHLPILAKVLEHTEGPILDLGMGLSTVLIHMMAKETKRQVFSYESDWEWFEANQIYKSDFHQMIFVKNWDFVEFKGVHWNIAMVDHAPAKRRKEEIKKLANCCDFILIHDSEPESDKFYKYSWIYDRFKYRYDYTKCRPNTTVLSNFVDLEFLA